MFYITEFNGKEKLKQTYLNKCYKAIITDLLEADMFATSI